MAYEMSGARAHDPVSHLRIIDDANALASSLNGPCFDGLNHWRRLSTAFGIAIALKAVRGQSFRETFTRFSDVVRVVAPTTPQAVVDKPKSFEALLIESYTRDANSQLARMSLAKPESEAVEDDEIDDDGDEYFPEMTAFRERAFFELQRV